MTTTTRATSTRKVRRDVTGGKRADGHQLQFFGRRRRPDPRSIRVKGDDPSVTSVAGLVQFGAFVRTLGVDAQLREQFGHLKIGPMVVYPMEAQLRLLIDAVIAGEQRVFGLESLAADPLFVKLAGGAVPSIDVLYDDLRRFGTDEIAALDTIMSAHGLAPVKAKAHKCVHLDIDTTVEPLFGTQIEGARPGPNPHYHGRPSYHPMLARITETGTIVGATLRPGDRSFGEADVPTVIAWVRRVRAAVGPHCQICVRIDGAGDCAMLLDALDREPRLTFFVKASPDARPVRCDRCAPEVVDGRTGGRRTSHAADSGHQVLSRALEAARSDLSHRSRAIARARQWQADLSLGRPRLDRSSVRDQ